MSIIKTMTNKINIYFIIICLILLSLITLGSIFDFEISKSLYLGQLPSDNFFGVLFAFIGIIPTFVGWSFLGASILCLTKTQNYSIKKRRCLIALAILLFVLSFFYFCNTLFLVNENAFYVHWAIAYPIGIIIILLASWLGYKLTKKSENPNLLKTILFLVLISIITMAIVMVSKEIMCRPRFRLLLTTDNDKLFINWWENGGKLKDFLNLNAANDEFSSFPSGHSAYAMFAIILFPAMSDYLPKLKKYNWLLITLGFIWWLLTALSRITVGAHYLSDVCIAGLIPIIIYFISYSIIKRKQKNAL